MRIAQKVTEDTLTESAFHRWMSSQLGFFAYPAVERPRAEAIADALRTATTPGQIADIIGTNAWTTVPACCHCGGFGFNFVVGFVEEARQRKTMPDMWVCKRCVEDLFTEMRLDPKRVGKTEQACGECGNDQAGFLRDVGGFRRGMPRRSLCRRCVWSLAVKAGVQIAMPGMRKKAA